MTSVDPARARAIEPQHTAHAHATVSRRALVKTAAWAVPVIAIAAPAPAFAASPGMTVNGISARFKAWYTKSHSARHIDIIGVDPQHPADGFFTVTAGVPGQAVSGVSVFVLIDKNIADSAWTPRNNVGDVYWKKPVKVSGPDAAGFYTYRIDYRTAVTDIAAAGTVFLDGRFHFRAPISAGPVKVKGLWHVQISPAAAPVVDVASVNTVSLGSDGDWKYVASPGA